MADFRRWMTVLTVLALFVGLASAQTGVTSPLACTTGLGAQTPQIRGEGYTELVGDIVIQCTGGQILTPGSVIPQANIVISFGTQITSRLLPNGYSSGESEVLLLIDEPGSGQTAPVTGWGPALPQNGTQTSQAPPSPLTGYQPLVGQAALAGNTCTGAGGAGCVNVAIRAGTAVAYPNNPATDAAPNVFKGIVSGSQVTFFGVPVLPPGSSGLARTFRITNIRINANPLNPGSAGAVTQVIASVASTGTGQLPISNPTPTVAFVQQSLSTSVSNYTGALSQCLNNGTGVKPPTFLGVLSYKELFGSAFKTRVFPNATQNSGQGQNLASGTQNIPGGVYYSESGFIAPYVTGTNSATAGLADYGTRLKAVFNNIPTGVTLYVSVANVTSTAGTALVTAPAAGTSVSSFAQLVTSETVNDGTGPAPTVPGTQGISTNTGSGGTDLVPVTITGGTGTAVWEVINDNPFQNETFYFAVYVAYVANPGASSPQAPSLGTVNMSYAPNPTQGAFTAAAGGVASSSLTIPRFADTSSANNILNIVICQTALLWPFVSNQAGFDTGLAIANTSTDPFGTTPQAGTCTLYFYGGFATGATPVSTYAVPSIAGGTVWASTIGSVAPGFQGYTIATCNFQYAHGYAALINSPGTVSQMFSSYLALIMNDGGWNGASLKQRPTGAGENLVH